MRRDDGRRIEIVVNLLLPVVASVDIAVVPGLDHALSLEKAEVFHQLLAHGFIAVRIGEKSLTGLKVARMS